MEEKTVLEYWLIIYKRRWLVLFVALSAMVTAGVISALLAPVYEARAKFFVPASPDIVSYFTRPDSVTRTPLVPMTSEEPHAPFIGILKSETIRKLVQEEFPHRSAHSLRRDVDFFLSSTYILEVYARDRSPVEAAKIANSYLKHLNGLLSDYSLSRADRNQRLLEGEIASVKERLAEATREMTNFQEKHQSVALDGEKKDWMSLKGDFLARLKAMAIEREANESKISALKEELQKEEALFASSNFYYTNPILEDLQRQLSLLEIRISGLKADMKDNHPDIVAARNQREQIEKNISNEIDRFIKSQIKTPNTFYESMRQQIVGLLVERQRILASIQAYSVAISDIETKIQEMPRLLGQSDAMRREIEKYRTMLLTLETKVEENKLQRKTELSNIVVLEKAVPPEEPIYPNPLLNAVVAGIAGILAGIVYCFFLNYLAETREQRILTMVRRLDSTER